MKSKSLKSVILIALVCLSMGAFAQPPAVTWVYIDTDAITPCPDNKPYNVKIDVTFRLVDGTDVFVPGSYVPIQDYMQIHCPVNQFSVVYTKIVITFYNGYCGSGASFPGVPASVGCPMHFKTNWWVSYSNIYIKYN